MKSLIENFANHLENALHNCKSMNLPNNNKIFENVLITGMGGSGIGGTIVRELAQNIKVPIMINKSYDLPTWVNKNTLVIASTYSGDTEETVDVIKTAINIGAEVAVITSGGQARKIADTYRLNHILIEGGNPPRSMLGYSLVAQMFLLNHYGITYFNIDKDITTAIALCAKKREI